MLLQRHVLDGIRTGAITLVFRRWRRPTVRAGGTLLTPIGQLTIAALQPMESGDITEADARRAGFESLAALRAWLDERDEGTIYKIELGELRPDPRVALREAGEVTEEERRDIATRLARLDNRASRPWTTQFLELIRAQPAVRAGDLCRVVGEEKLAFKEKVRRLKALGLTESLDVGYRLSPRGTGYLAESKK